MNMHYTVYTLCNVYVRYVQISLNKFKFLQSPPTIVNIYLSIKLSFLEHIYRVEQQSFHLLSYIAKYVVAGVKTLLSHPVPLDSLGNMQKNSEKIQTMQRLTQKSGLAKNQAINKKIHNFYPIKLIFRQLLYQLMS